MTVLIVALDMLLVLGFYPGKNKVRLSNDDKDCTVAKTSHKDCTDTNT